MAKVKRVRRDEVELEDNELLKPFDINKLGSNDDPCFGKHHSLSEPECIRCGDNELCQVVTSQKEHITRIQDTKNTKFLDLEEADIVSEKQNEKELIKFIKRSLKKGRTEKFMLRIGKKKYNGEPKTIKKLIKKYGR